MCADHRVPICALLLAFPVMGQTMPNSGALPRDGSSTTLQGFSPSEARSQYESLDPESKRAVKQAAEQAKARHGNDPAMRAQLRSILRSWKGQ